MMTLPFSESVIRLKASSPVGSAPFNGWKGRADVDTAVLDKYVLVLGGASRSMTPGWEPEANTSII